MRSAGPTLATAPKERRFQRQLSAIPGQPELWNSSCSGDWERFRLQILSTLRQPTIDGQGLTSSTGHREIRTLHYQASLV